jgi:L-fuconolactonase
MRIDSHHHFWNYGANDYPWITPAMDVLRRDFGPHALQESATSCGIKGAISVQARQSLLENEFLLANARESTLIQGVVGWVPLRDPLESLCPLLEQLAAEDKFVGVRHVVQDEPDDRFLLGAEFSRGIAQLRHFQLVYDLLIYARQLPAAIEFVDRHPEQTFVLDHIAKPTIAAAELDVQWARDLPELAKRPNVYCKFSGVVTEIRDSQWDLETIRPYWDLALEAFGSKRLMYGSDWPVCLLKATYRQWIELVEQLVADLSPLEQAMFWHQNASLAYNL